MKAAQLVSFALLAVVLALSADIHNARAVGPDPDGVIVGFAMSTMGNSCPQNSPGTGEDCRLGSIGRCESVQVGSPVIFDVFVDDLELDSVSGFQYEIGGWPTNGSITSQTHSGAPAMITSRAGSVFVESSEAVPDTAVPHQVSVVDTGTAEHNPPYTRGVLGRYTLDTTGVSPGVYDLTLSNVVIFRSAAADADYPDYPLGGSIAIQAVKDANFWPEYGQVAVGISCPDGILEDVEIVSQALIAPPTEINIGQDVQVTLRKTLRDNGPDWGYAVVSIAADAVAPAGCSAAPSPSNPTTADLSYPNTDVTVDESWTLHCSQPGIHEFTFNNVVGVTGPGFTFDPDLSNNSASTPLSVDVIGGLDSDDDGLADEVDVEPLTFSSAFSDQLLGGTTFGSLERNGLTVEVREEPNPAGVKVTASGSGGPAIVNTCDTNTLDFTSGDDAVVTCDSATIEVLVGPVEATFGPLRGSLPAGTTTTVAELAPGAFEVTNSAESSASITVNGIQISPAHTESDDDGDGFFTSVEQYVGTDSLDNCPDGPSDDAWPLDIDRDGAVSGTGDAFNYVGRIGATPVSPNWWQRLDLDMDSAISVTGDVFMYVGRIGETCP